MDKYLNLIRNGQPNNKVTLIVFIVLLSAVFILSAYSRYNQLSVWQENKAQFFTQDTPMMTTLDAYKFLRHAREVEAGTFNPDVKDQMIFYPDGSPFPDPAPLMSVTLNSLVQIFGGSYYMTAMYMIPIMSSLFIIPLGIYFFLLGFPAAGLLGGLITTYAPMFYGRTGIGRFDTDGMNLFFLLTAGLFIFLASRAKTQRMMYIFSALGGFTVMLFFWWYHHGMFNIFFPVVLVATLFLAKVKWKDIGIATAIFILFSNPYYLYVGIGHLLRGVNVYLFPIKEASIFPNVFATISEAQSAGVMQLLGYISNPYLGILGILGCVILAIAYFKKLIPLAAVVILGFMSFTSASRFTIFLAPVIGVGIGYIMTLIINYGSNERTQMLRNASAYASVVVLFTILTVSDNNAFKSIPRPSMHPQTFQSFMTMKQILPENAAILTWWDFGLAITEASGFKVFHSGMTQESPKTWMIAKALTSDEQTLYNISSYVDTFGISEVPELRQQETIGDVTRIISSYDKGPKNDATYVLITLDMPQKMQPISYLANWNNATNSSNPLGIQRLQCNPPQNNVLACSNNYSINLTTGLINNQTPVATYINTIGGKVASSRNFNYADGIYVIHDATGLVYLMRKDTFDTSLVQLYMLNNYNAELFTPALDMYPFARLFKLNMKANSDNISDNVTVE